MQIRTSTTYQSSLAALQAQFPAWGLKRLLQVNDNYTTGTPTSPYGSDPPSAGPVPTQTAIQSSGLVTYLTSVAAADPGWDGQWYLDWEPPGEWGGDGNSVPTEYTAASLSLTYVQNIAAAIAAEGKSAQFGTFGNYSIWPNGSDGPYNGSDSTLAAINATLLTASYNPKAVIAFTTVEMYAYPGFDDEITSGYLTTFKTTATNKVAAAKAYGLPVYVFIQPYVNGNTANPISTAYTVAQLTFLNSLGVDVVVCWDALGSFALASAFWTGVSNFASAQSAATPPAPPTLGVPTVNCDSSMTVVVNGVVGATVALSVSPGSELYTGTIGSTGSLSMTVPALPNAAYTATATQKTTGGTSGASNQINWTVSQITTVKMLTLTPNPGAGVAVHAAVNSGCGAVSVQPSATNALGQSTVTFTGKAGSTLNVTFTGATCSAFSLQASVGL